MMKTVGRIKMRNYVYFVLIVGIFVQNYDRIAVHPNIMLIQLIKYSPNQCKDIEK